MALPEQFGGTLISALPRGTDFAPDNALLSSRFRPLAGPRPAADMSTLALTIGRSARPSARGPDYHLEIVNVIGTRARSGGIRFALALITSFALQSAADAAFTISINGTVVATDGGAGDMNPTGHEVWFIGVIDGYELEIMANTFTGGGASGGAGAGIQTSQLQAVRTGGGSMPLMITLSETFTQPAGTTGAYDLTSELSRDLVAGYETSGMVRMTTSAASLSGGGTGSTDEILLSPPSGSGSTDGTFGSTSQEYTLTQTITVQGLGNDKAVLIRAESTARGEGLVLSAPGPSAPVLLLSGAGFFALIARFRKTSSKT